MPITLTSSLEVARRALWGNKAWLWFAEIDAINGGKYRLVRSNRHIEANGLKWQRCMFGLQLAGVSDSGVLGAASITIPDPTGTAASILDSADTLEGMQVAVQLAHKSELSSFNPQLRWVQEISSVGMTKGGVSISCDEPVMQMVPAETITRIDFPALNPLSTVGGVS